MQLLLNDWRFRAKTIRADFVLRVRFEKKIFFFFVVGLFKSREKPNESQRCDNATSVYTPNHSADYGPRVSERATGLNR